MIQLLEVHGFDLVVEAGRVGLVEGVVLQRNDHLLPVEIDFLELEGGVPVLAVVGLLVVRTVVEDEGEV